MLKRYKQHEKTEQAVYRNSHSAAQHQQDDKLQLLWADSSTNQIEVTLWPAGSFTYTPQNGFTGQAHQLQIKGLQHNQQHALLNAQHYTDSAVLKNATVQKKQKQILTQKQNARSGYSWWVVGIALLLLLYGYSKWKD